MQEAPSTIMEGRMGYLLRYLCMYAHMYAPGCTEVPWHTLALEMEPPANRSSRVVMVERPSGLCTG